MITSFRFVVKYLDSGGVIKLFICGATAISFVGIRSPLRDGTRRRNHSSVRRFPNDQSQYFYPFDHTADAIVCSQRSGCCRCREVSSTRQLPCWCSNSDMLNAHGLLVGWWRSAGVCQIPRSSSASGRHNHWCFPYFFPRK